MFLVQIPDCNKVGLDLFTNEMEILKQNIFSYRIDNSHFVCQQQQTQIHVPIKEVV